MGPNMSTRLQRYDAIVHLVYILWLLGIISTHAKRCAYTSAAADAAVR